VCGISTDITDRTRAEAELKHERYLLHSLLENVPDAIYFKDADCRFTRINRSLAEKNGLANPSEAIGKSDFDFFTAEHARPAFEDEQAVMRTGQPIIGKEEEETWPDGRVTWVLTTKLPLRDVAGKIVGTFGISRDITTRKQAEEALRVSERRYRQLTEGTRDAIVVGNEQGLITLFNPAAQKAFGYTEDEVLGQPLTMLMPEQYHAAHRGGLARYLQTREPRLVGRTLELEGRRKNGQVFPLELSLCAVELPEGITFMGTIRDITERRRAAAERQRMQARVIQAEKLASLGLLSAGVAHEINNPLAYVANNLAVLERDVRGLKSLLEAYEQAQPALESARPDLAARTARIAHQIDLPYVRDNLDRVLETTRQGIQRVADIVQSLRGFARIEQAAFAPGDIHEDILSSLEMIRGRLNRRNISVQQRFGQLPPVACAHGQINQVFLNLLVNAMHAIQAAGRSDGHIEIATRAADGTVVIEVADNGCGITPEQLQRIFDPFYTTKPVGEGTGLGLSISHSIVSDHGGRIEVESTPGEGSRFRVILPVE
jgi:PAS domain S-box-containing protein